MNDTQGHMLVMLPKADPTAKTWSGKCKGGDARYNAGSEDEVQGQHRNHLRDLGLLQDGDQPIDEEPVIDPPVDADALGEMHGNEREQAE